MKLPLELVAATVERVDAAALLLPVDGQLCRLGGAAASALRLALHSDQRADELEYVEDELERLRPLPHPQARRERLGDVRSKAVTMGKSADILMARGELDEALRILRQDQLPIYERLGNVREKAVTMPDRRHSGGPWRVGTRRCGSSAKTSWLSTNAWVTCGKRQQQWGRSSTSCRARGELRGVAHSPPRRVAGLRAAGRRAIAGDMGKLTDILKAGGELDEALRIRHQGVLPVFDRLGDVRSKAVTRGKIAEILMPGAS